MDGKKCSLSSLQSLALLSFLSFVEVCCGSLPYSCESKVHSCIHSVPVFLFSFSVYFISHASVITCINIKEHSWCVAVGFSDSSGTFLVFVFKNKMYALIINNIVKITGAAPLECFCDLSTQNGLLGTATLPQTNKAENHLFPALGSKWTCVESIAAKPNMCKENMILHRLCQERLNKLIRRTHSQSGHICPRINTPNTQSILIYRWPHWKKNFAWPHYSNFNWCAPNLRPKA